MTNMSSAYTSTFSTGKRIPATTFDSILPSDKITTWEHEDAKAKQKNSSAELAGKAKTAVGATIKSAMKKADGLKKAVDEAKAKRETDKQIRKTNKDMLSRANGEV